MIQIPLTKGAFALVDEQDHELVAQYKWHLNDMGYAVHRGIIDGQKKTIRMHRLIMNPPEDRSVDHINRDPLDNRRENLRIVTHAENMQNLGTRRDNTSGQRGVDYQKRENRWRARYRCFGVDYASYHLTFEEAVKGRKQLELTAKQIQEESDEQD